MADELPDLKTLALALLRLEGDPDFERLEETQSRSNLFRIVGTSERERWHSAFWAWIFDPAGSHGLGDYGLRRLLARAADANGHLRGVALRRDDAIDGDDSVAWRPAPASTPPLSLDDLARLRVIRSVAAPGPSSGYSEVTARATSTAGGNKRASRGDANRFDVLVVIEAEFSTGSGGAAPIPRALIFCVVEMKVNAKYESQQLARYSEWLHVNPSSQLLTSQSNDTTFRTSLEDLVSSGADQDTVAFAYGFFMAPKLDAIEKLADAPSQLVPAWNPVSFAELVPDVLESALEHPRIDAPSQALIKNYVDLIASDSIGVNYMPTEHQKLVQNLIQRHRSTFAMIAAVLGASEDATDVATSEPIGEELSAGDLRAKSFIPGDLVEAGIIQLGTRFVHRPMTLQRTKAKPFEDPIVVELADAGSRSAFKLVAGPEALVAQDRRYTSTGAVTTVYKHYGEKIGVNGNAVLEVASGEHKGKSLQALHETLRNQGA